MSCHRCHWRVNSSRSGASLQGANPLVEDWDTDIPLLYDNTAGFPRQSTDPPTIQGNVYRPSVPNYPDSARTLRRPLSPPDGSQPGNFPNYVPTYSNSTRTVSGRPEQSVGPQGGQIVPSLPRVYGTYRPTLPNSVQTKQPIVHDQSARAIKNRWVQ